MTTEPRPTKRGAGWWLGAGLFVVFALALFGNMGRDRDEDDPAPAAPAAKWWPADFALTSDPTVAYRWLKDTEFKCEFADRCWGMMVIARDGCPRSLYVELSIADSAGTAVGYTNDTVGAVRANQQAKLVFDNLEETGRRATLADVSCY